MYGPTEIAIFPVPESLHDYPLEIENSARCGFSDPAFRTSIEALLAEESVGLSGSCYVIEREASPPYTWAVDRESRKTAFR